MGESIIKNFILTWKALIGFGIVIAIVGGIQYGVHAAVKDNSAIAHGAACTMKSFEADSRNVRMKLDCGGNEDATENAKFVAAYLQKPGPFTCTRYYWAYADCKLQEAEKPAK